MIAIIIFCLTAKLKREENTSRIIKRKFSILGILSRQGTVSTRKKITRSEKWEKNDEHWHLRGGIYQKSHSAWRKIYLPKSAKKNYFIEWMKIDYNHQNGGLSSGILDFNDPQPVFLNARLHWSSGLGRFQSRFIMCLLCSSDFEGSSVSSLA